MQIGVPREIKEQEYRVGLTPSSVRELVAREHPVLVESGAGSGIGHTDDDYRAAGAEIATTPEEVFERAELVVKVKEPGPPEFGLLREGQVLFTYLHLAPDREQTEALVESGCVAVAYETVTDPQGGLPLLTPMSQVAGRLAIQAGAHCLEKAQGGAGLLLGGVAGVAAARVVVIGGGVVGTNALRMAIGLETKVTVLDRSLRRLEELDHRFGAQLNTIYAGMQTVEEHVLGADLVIGAVLVPGAEAPKLVTRDMVTAMRPGSVLVDVAIDQGGCFETSRPTTHAEPTFLVDDVVHYCVANMPGGVPRTSTIALNNATLPFTMALAEKGYRQAMADDHHLRAGLNVHRGRVTYEAVARAHGHDYLSAEKALAQN